MSQRFSQIAVGLSAALLIVPVSQVAAGGLHHKKQAQYVAVPVGTMTVQPAAAVPQIQTVQMAVPQVQMVQMAVPQVQVVQMAVPQVQTVQMSVPQVQTVQMSVPQQQAVPQFELKIVEAPQPSAAVPQMSTPQSTPQAQKAMPQAQQSTPQPQQSTPSATSGSLVTGQSYQLYRIVEHRCHLFCKH